MPSFMHGLAGALLAAALLLAPPASAASATASGDRLANDGNMQAAEQAYAAAHREAPGDVDVIIALARSRMRLEQGADAVRLAEEATTLAPDRARPWLVLGEALAVHVNEVGMLRKMKIARRIRDAYVKAVEVEPDNAEALLSLAMYHLVAPGIVGGDKARGEAEVTTLLEMDPVRGRMARAQQAMQAQDEAAAETALRAAAAATPDAMPSVALAVWLDQQDRADEALTVLQDATRRAPDAPAPYYQIGRLAAAGHGPAAAGISALETYLELPLDWTSGDPPRAWARYRLAQIHAATGDPERARAEYRQALALNPDFSEARAALDALPEPSSHTDTQEP